MPRSAETIQTGEHRSTCLHTHACCPPHPGCNVSQSVTYSNRNARRFILRPFLSEQLNVSQHPCSMQAHTAQGGRLPPTAQHTAAQTIGMLPHPVPSSRLRAGPAYSMRSLSLRQAGGVISTTQRRGQLAVLSGGSTQGCDSSLDATHLHLHLAPNSYYDDGDQLHQGVCASGVCASHLTGWQGPGYLHRVSEVSLLTLAMAAVQL